MRRRWWIVSLVAAALFASSATAVHAHVPYIEREDYTAEAPLHIRDVEQSIAAYGWLETDEDVDHLRFELDGPVRLYLQVLVPACVGYEEFRPSLAVLGPGLPDPEVELPVQLPPGYGAWTLPSGLEGEPREQSYEPFGGKSYYEGPVLERTISEPGPWELVYWDPEGHIGDYVAVVGTEERFPLRDILRSIINTWTIRRDGELHIDCRPPAE